MNHTLIEDLDELLSESQKMLVASEVGFKEWQVWSDRRDQIFMRLQSSDFSHPVADPSDIAKRVEEILKTDARVTGKLKNILAELNHQIAAARKARPVMNSVSYPASILERRA